MESKETKNEGAFRTASDLFKIDYSNSAFDDNLYKNYYGQDDHVIQLDQQITDNQLSGHQMSDHQLSEHLTSHLNEHQLEVVEHYSTNNNDENSDENSQMLVKDKEETIVKIDEYNENADHLLNKGSVLRLDLPTENKECKKQEVNDEKKCKQNLLNHQLTQSHSSKFEHHHHHYLGNNSRGMDLVFRNIHVSIPTQPVKRSIAKQDKELISNNWFKQLFSKIHFSNQVHKLKSSKAIDSNNPTSTTSDQHHRDILTNISGYTRSGQLLAVMGPTASGKTTLLNTLSGRLKARKGSVMVNGEELNKQMKRKIGYVMQNDAFFAGLTLKQTLVYTALLRMPDSMSRAKKLKHVQRVIELLDLTSCQDTIIGDFMKRGLSGGEKKRASIACELLTNPSIMLLDEPTSGLDSCTAFSLMQKIKEYAIKEGKIVIATIHQPSSNIFYMFDKLLLLANGQLAYFGKSTHVVPFFEGLGYTISAHYNPADLMMEKIKQKDELPKIVKAAKSLIKNYSILSHSHHRGSNASNCKHLLKLNKMESQTDWSLIGIEDDLEHDHNHLSNCSQTENETNRHQLIQHHSHHHCHHHFQKHHLNTLKESTECTNYNKNIGNNADLCLDLCCKRAGCKLLIRTIHDDDSGRSSWTETDRSSTATFSSSNSCSSSTCSTEDMYSEVNFEIELKNQQNRLTNRTNSNLTHEPHSKWPTSFFTQVDVLTRRNFCETRHRMLSKLNWIQTIGLGILSGMMWFQMNRLESTLNDMKGFLFFSTSYWMLFAWFGVLISIPGEREVMKKERSSGAYRLSAFYVAKMIGELPLIITLPSLYFFICYPMFAINLNFYNFLFQWLFMVLCALVAQSIGLFIGLMTMSLEVSVTVSAIYSTAVNLFGGYYSSTLPKWLSWMRYTSVLHYAYENMQMIEYKYGGEISCANVNSKFDYCLKQIAELKEKLMNETIQDQSIEKVALHKMQLDNQNLIIPYDALISELNSPCFWFNVFVLILFLLFFRLLGYLVLRFK